MIRWCAGTWNADGITGARTGMDGVEVNKEKSQEKITGDIQSENKYSL
jgi:hypothetical protein